MYVWLYGVWGFVIVHVRAGFDDDDDVEFALKISNLRASPIFMPHV